MIGWFKVQGFKVQRVVPSFRGDFFTSSAQSWDHMNPDLPKFSKQPKLKKTNLE
jgi:hypothetical protein